MCFPNLFITLKSINKIYKKQKIGLKIAYLLLLFYSKNTKFAVIFREIFTQRAKFWDYWEK